MSIESKKSAEVTHNHPEGIKGAQSVAMSIFFAKSGASKDQIKEAIIKGLRLTLQGSVILPNIVKLCLVSNEERPYSPLKSYA